MEGFDPQTSFGYEVSKRYAAGHIMLDAGRYHPVTQILDLNHVRISADGVILSPPQVTGLVRSRPQAVGVTRARLGLGGENAVQCAQCGRQAGGADCAESDQEA